MKRRTTTSDETAVVKSPLARKLVLWAVTAGFITSIIASLLQFYLNYQYRRAHVNTNIEQIGSTFLPSLTQSLWAFDLPQTKLQMETIIKQPYVSSAELILEDGTPTQSYGTHSTTDKPIEKRFPLHHVNKRGQTTELGTLVLRKDFGEEQEKLINDGFYSFLSNTLIIVVIAFSITQIFQIAVTRRLTQIASRWGKISENDLRNRNLLDHFAPHPTRNSEARDELDIVENAIELLFMTGYRALQDAEEKEQTLIDLKKKADSANTAKSEFLANMSHEIRTPMNGVTGIAELLTKTELTSNQAALVNQLQLSAHNLLQIINDVLDFTKIEADQLEPIMAEVNLDTLLSEVALSLSAQAHKKGINLICPASPPLHLNVSTDDVRIRQVLVNLIGNAIKFTAEGEVAVDCRCTAIAGDTATVRFSVRDTGIGIPPDQQDKLFDRFSQIDNSVTRAFSGTGLGLAICKKLVELLGGEIGVTSASTGSEFWFSLPLQVINHREKPVCSGTEKIMLVGLSDTQNSYICDVLEHFGADCSAHAPSLALLDTLTQKADVSQIWIDQRGQNLGTTALAQAIKTAPGYDENTLCILLTDNPLFERKLHPEFDAVLTKPVQHEAIWQILNRSGKALQRVSSALPTDTSTSLPAGIRVLIVEDNPVNQLVAEGLLTQMNIHFETAHNGLEALEKLRSTAFDLVFMDCQMPVLDGYEATRAIRREPDILNNNIPVVAMTANALMGDREKCLAAGMDDYIAKPISYDKLADALKHWCSAKPASDNSALHLPPATDEKDCESLIQNEIFDFKQMQRMLLDDTELITSVIKTFLDDISSLVPTLRTDAANSSLEELAKKAHKIKGASANVAAHKLSASALALEVAGKAGNGENLDALITELESDYDQLHASLSHQLRELNG